MMPMFVGVGFDVSDRAIAENGKQNWLLADDQQQAIEYCRYNHATHDRRTTVHDNVVDCATCGQFAVVPAKGDVRKNGFWYKFVEVTK